MTKENNNKKIKDKKTKDKKIKKNDKKTNDNNPIDLKNNNIDIVFLLFFPPHTTFSFFFRIKGIYYNYYN